MKKYLFLVMYLGLIGIFSTVEAKTTPVFDGCGTGGKYESYSWFSDLQSKLQKLDIKTTGDSWNWDASYVSDMCYSASRNQVIINIPYMVVSDKKKLCKNDGEGSPESLCKVTVNVFSYDIKTGKFARALRDTNTIYEGLTKNYTKNKLQLFVWNDARLGYQSAGIATRLSQFGKRVGDYISMTSGYGDAGCGSNYKRKYYYKTNIIEAVSLTSGCYNEETGKMTEKITYFGKK